MKRTRIKTRTELRYDNHTVSLLTNHLVFSPKYRGRVLVGEVLLATDEVIRKLCKELGIVIIDMAVNVDHVHIFFRYPPRYSLSYVAREIKGKSSRELRKRFPHLKRWCKTSLWASSCFHGAVGQGWDIVEKYISSQRQYPIQAP